jgi:Protein of unknown function (DUF3237)
MPESTLPVEFLFTMKATLAPTTVVQGGPQGSRAIVPVTGGTFEGPKLKGTVVPPGGDWVTVRADGSFKLDVRVTLLTEDGAAIHVTYNGIGVRKDGRTPLRTAPLFETGDPRYAWLNSVQAVGLGFSGQGEVAYDIYALTV